ncbi:BPSL1445 family SYLF domain-containing lipoprotein [Pseudoduganella sp. RAF53_2]|uniref:BPSL1445 family SYLF domain-containing lipoprotein n=1 Tax=unclassified Pseudoduganella TaxID=2637179 RepID=UPI003F9B1456
MRNRMILLKTVAALALAGMSLGACTTTTTANKAPAADQRADIVRGADTTLDRLYKEVKGSRELVAKSNGALVFPNVVNAGLIVGGEYGKGVLITGGRPSGYYSMGSVSVGLQAGAQSKAIIILFMTRDALEKFRASSGWTAGVDGTVAVLKVGANGEVDTTTATQPVEAMVLTNAGLMAGVSLEGTKISKLDL